MYTDSNPVTYILTSAKLDPTGHWCVAPLAAYNISIKHSFGKENLDADALSRIPGLASDTYEYMEITPEMFNVNCRNCQTIPYTRYN